MTAALIQLFLTLLDILVPVQKELIMDTDMSSDGHECRRVSLI
jgi:hypothetical protein